MFKFQEEQLWKRINEEIGDSCVICGSNLHLVCHEINFIRHRMTKNVRTQCRFYLNNKERFIRLCYTCHKLLHYLERNPIILLFAPINSEFKPFLPNTFIKIFG